MTKKKGYPKLRSQRVSKTWRRKHKRFVAGNNTERESYSIIFLIVYFFMTLGKLPFSLWKKFFGKNETETERFLNNVITSAQEGEGKKSEDKGIIDEGIEDEGINEEGKEDEGNDGNEGNKGNEGNEGEGDEGEESNGDEGEEKKEEEGKKSKEGKGDEGKKSKLSRKLPTIPENSSFVKDIPEKTSLEDVLQKECPDPGQCLVFGKLVDEIKRYFENFDFKYVQYNEIKQIGNDSGNGFVLEIPFSKHNYKTYTVLKCAHSSQPEKNKYPDNLYYEAFVGSFVNKWNKQFPCFLETYNIYTIDSTLRNMLLRLVTEKKLNTLSTFTTNPFNLLYPFEEVNFNNPTSFLSAKNINKSCERFEDICILIQHLQNSITFESYLKKIVDEDNTLNKYINFMTFDLIYYLYQIYSCLGTLANDFTHYDLHINNVLLLDLTKSDDLYVKMIYHYADKSSISFYTRYVVKIIDYGRCYVPFSNQLLDILKNRLDTPNCESNGENLGYRYLTYPKQYPFINLSKKNISHDLLFCEYCKMYFNIIRFLKNTNIYKNVLDKIYYHHKNVFKDQKIPFGTNEITNPPSNSNKTIFNVIQMHQVLKQILTKNNNTFQLFNSNFYSKKTQIGEMNIYLDEPKKKMEFHSSI